MAEMSRGKEAFQGLGYSTDMGEKQLPSKPGQGSKGRGVAEIRVCQAETKVKFHPIALSLSGN